MNLSRRVRKIVTQGEERGGGGGVGCLVVFYFWRRIACPWDKPNWANILVLSCDNETTESSPVYPDRTYCCYRCLPSKKGTYVVPPPSTSPILFPAPLPPPPLPPCPLPSFLQFLHISPFLQLFSPCPRFFSNVFLSFTSLSYYPCLNNLVPFNRDNHSHLLNLLNAQTVAVASVLQRNPHLNL